MNQNNLLAILRENRLMQTQQQVTDFENTLAEIADNPDEQNLSAYHLVLDDQCQHPEVMFSLIHFLESFETEEQITSFIKVVPQLMIDASEWTRIIHNRILNDDLSCQVYQKLLHSANLNTPHFLYHLLEESIVNKLKTKESLSSITQ
ncbi:MAG: Imm30 family immunity protein [Nostoc sp. CmiVER01]|uniref:Imm30 family immunity protein n=1 Tax=Nostoc sp. CmiVER01 TaxID=3075384 RepID=UPI002AD41BA1|nr:Imm30 family immunity protein [Nostoc sp. CmiVER01]MDZ8121512.1 Imm30 family immunity protein [Nostoc sp. CmiVER01]